MVDLSNEAIMKAMRVSASFFCQLDMTDSH